MVIRLEKKMIEYDKIIRDKIPEIIEKSGKNYELEPVEDGVAEKYLIKKLQEELDEFYENNKLEELADIIEVIEAIAVKRGETFQGILKIKEDKKEKRGGFGKNLILKKVY